MAAMKKRMVIAATAGVWLAALGSAAALTYDLNRPLHGVEFPLAVAVPAVPVFFDPPAPGSEPELTIPTVTIVARTDRPATQRSAPKPPTDVSALKPPTDISKMRCADWRSLDVGSGRVQVCE